MNILKNKLMLNGGIINREIFYFFTATIFTFVILEIIWPNLIIVYFNLNYLLILWLASGLASIIKK